MTPSAVLAGEASWCVLEGDCITLDIPAESIDAVVSDPPAGIGFMGKDWDHHKGGRDAWVAWMAERMRVAFRLLKPGGHALIWALPRTSHWTATAVEDAGFEVRDVLTHHFGSGFPKSLDVSKAIDSAAGAVRTEAAWADRYHDGRSRAELGSQHHAGAVKVGATANGNMVTAPATPEAAQWQGWGTALKPASEHWILARKPLIGTVAANVLAHGTGGINVDACRVEAVGGSPAAARRAAARKSGNAPMSVVSASESESAGRIGRRGSADVYMAERPGEALGRWPTNLLLSHSEGCNGVCAPDCPVAELDRQSGTLTSGAFDGVRNGTETRTAYGTFLGNQGSPRHANSGGASRFYPTFQYVPKAPRSMREAGLQAAENERANDHPTVKHDDLMRWLVRLVTPPGGVVLDMFCGSGSTGRGALMEGFRFIGIDAEAHYVEIAKARIADAEPKPDRQLTIFELLAS